MSEATTNYRTYQIRIKQGHRLYAYLDEACRNAKNLYNTTNFYIRQLFTAMRQDGPLQPLQQEVLDAIEAHLNAMNACLREKNRECPFTLPTKEKAFPSYSFLDALFKVMKQVDYLVLPAQSSQAVMKHVFQAWRSFFASVRDYRKQPHKYTGRPRIPDYARSNVKEVLFSNQDCVIKADVNGAANIMRKVFPDVRASGTDGIAELDGIQSVNVSTPLVVSILK